MYHSLMANDRRPTQDFVPRYEHIATIEDFQMLHFGARLTLAQISAKLLKSLSQITGAPR